MKTRNKIAVAIVVLSYIVLIPGLTKDIITINASISVLGNQTEVFRDTRSILGTIDGLHESGNDLVAGLIFLFSVLVPFIKGGLLALAAVLKRLRARMRLFAFVRSISKWAMADVFVVGVYIAFLSARATDNLDAQLHAGFYYFAGYCLLSLLALQFMQLPGSRAELGSDPATA